MSLMLPWLIKWWKQAFVEHDRRILLPLFWIVLVVLFFSISPGKRGVYILPALPMLALISAPYLDQILQQKWFNRLLAGVVALISFALLIIGVAGYLEINTVVKALAKYDVTPWAFLSTLGLIGFASVLVTIKKQKFVSWLLFIPSLWLLYSTWGYQLLEPVKTPKNVFVNMAKFIPADAEIGIVGLREQFLLFSPYHTTHFGYHTPEKLQFSKAWQWQKQGQSNGKKRYILTFKKTDMQCFDINQAIDVGRAHSRDWIIFTDAAQQDNCPAPDESVHAFSYQAHK
jgi:hypothetical protein